LTVEEIIERRNIIEVVHFTPHTGLLGTLHAGAVKSRHRLPKEVDLEHIYKPNAELRRDSQWLDYVNLSISRINATFFWTSCRWHRTEDLWWCILAFDPIILTHPGVVFTTTNNMYTGVCRAPGPAGLEKLFSPYTTQWYGKIVTRLSNLPDCFPTCIQAEALYPGELSIQYLRRVYVVREDDLDEVYAQLHMIGITGVDVIVAPSKFNETGVNYAASS
jgi:ssDNA thymidine ADP-ribosyltransferase, DarT